MATTTKKKPTRARKPATRRTTPKKAPPRKKTGTSPTHADVTDGYLAHLIKVGKSAGTVASYRADLRIAMRELGENTKVSALTERKVQAYFDSDAVTLNRAGKPKSPITVAKIRRVLRLAVVWAAEQGLIAKAPISKPKKS